MSFLKNAIQNAKNHLTAASKELIESGNEVVIWRRQIVGLKNPLAQNAIGIDPTGLYWQTEDIYVYASYQGRNQHGQQIIFAHIDPTQGDLIIRLEGLPQTEDAARHARRTTYMKVVNKDVRRDPRGRILQGKVFCEIDRTGKYQEYGQGGRLHK